MILGCIADDLTGATDLSLMLSKEGLRTVQSTGLPPRDLDLSDVDALVIALKSRSIAAEQAVKVSLEAAETLTALGARQLLFKYCSTFDSTDEGNIGPVADALLDFVGGTQTVFCPAFPRAGRTVYCANLFVNGVPLAESPMKDHPLNPMRDSDLRRVLQRQTHRGVGHVGFESVEAGSAAIRAALAEARKKDLPFIVLDTLTDRHLREIGAAVFDHKLITGGSGIGMGLPEAYRAAGWLPDLTPAPVSMEAPAGRRAILAGSCSTATRGQVRAAQAAGIPALQITPEIAKRGEEGVAEALAWAKAQPQDKPVLLYSSADPDVVEALQRQLGRQKAGTLFEDVFAALARGLADGGFTRMIVAGGETAGAVVTALDAGLLAIGPEIDPGVPWTRNLRGVDIALALKSGNFGAEDFFTKAWEQLI
ncbi:3-oxo-tetronate kinase [Afifella sp. IM 167]|uniref:3-oxo-tetronate kinase n=1 Tax=Afifella sp. IM 167 TaxID=2033586 RepID=UPI001CCCB538|nr:3-oxo-tetronate kinase [Afifella sp. IM 167]MBZ8135138.1 hypothetical protein [Afifella sp. IM 167]